MKHKNIKWIIILVSVALTTLIIFQLYWISNAYAYQKKQLASEVKQVLAKAGKSTVAKSTCFELFGKFSVKPNEGIYFAKQDWKENSQFISPGEKAPDSVKMFFLDKEDTSIYSYNSIKFTRPVSAEFTMRYVYLHNDNPANLNSAKADFQNPAELHYNDFLEKLSGGATIDKRLSMSYLDSVLNKLIKAAGLSPDYHYGLIRSDNNNIEYFSKNSDLKKLGSSDLNVEIINDPYFSHPYKLALYFDSGYSQVFNNLWLMLGSSLVIISLLCYAFWYFIRTILTQRKLSEMKTDFINNMTHEFKTPITNIGLAVENIQEKWDLNGSTPYLKIIGDENNRLRENVERILQIASLDKEDITLDIGEVNVNLLIEKICQDIELTFLSREPEIHYELKAGNPVILADETHVINIISNLVDNAIKYCNSRPDITISTCNSSDGVMIQVKDNGIGMDRITQKKIFEKFYRAHTGNIHNVKGFGLGLAYTKSLIGLHKGSITVESEPGRGSMFTIFLPYSIDYKSINANEPGTYING
jgi:two-component system, OmpR family, phosphate regulon sensor histidine kinase PhoR